MSSDNPTPEEPDNRRPEQAIAPQGTAVEKTTDSPASTSPTTVQPTGNRQALRNIRRQLDESELASSGVQKLLIEMLERAESDCEIAEGYRDRYHAADKRAAVLEEKGRTQTALEILFAVGLAIGGVLIGLAPSFWDASYKGPTVLAFGIVLILGSVIGRVAKR
jgi:hypothetical protein